VLAKPARRCSGAVAAAAIAAQRAGVSKSLHAGARGRSVLGSLASA